MTTLVPRGPYSHEELRKLYPANLELQLVQVVGPQILLTSVLSQIEGRSKS